MALGMAFLGLLEEAVAPDSYQHWDGWRVYDITYNGRAWEATFRDTQAISPMFSFMKPISHNTHLRYSIGVSLFGLYSSRSVYSTDQFYANAMRKT